MQESRQWILVGNAILMTVWKEMGCQLYESESFNYFFMPDHRIKESPSSTQNHRFSDVALGFHPAKCSPASSLDDIFAGKREQATKTKCDEIKNS